MYFYKSFIWHGNTILTLVTYASFIVSVLIVYTIYISATVLRIEKLSITCFCIFIFFLYHLYSEFLNVLLLLCLLLTCKENHGWVESKSGKVNLSKLRGKYRKNKLQISEDPKRLRHLLGNCFQHGLFPEFSESLCYFTSHNHMLVICKVRGKTPCNSIGRARKQLFWKQAARKLSWWPLSSTRVSNVPCCDKG